MKIIQMRSALTKKEIYIIMKDLIYSKHPLFKGNVTDDSFSVMRWLVFSNNALNPMINATVTEIEDGSLISAKATLNKTDKIGAWMMGVALLGLIVFFTVSAIISRSLEPLSGVIFVVFAAAFFNLIFRLKLHKTIKILKQELSAK